MPPLKLTVVGSAVAKILPSHIMSIWQFDRKVLLTPVPPEAVLLNTATGETYVLNQLGLNICLLIQQNYSQSAIVELLIEHFPDAATSIPTDVAELIAQLETEKLLYRVEG